MTWDGLTERRRHPRARIRLLMAFEDEGSGAGSQPVLLETLNFGAGGFYGDIDRRLEPLTKLGLRLVFPPFGPDCREPRTIECEAIVVRVDEPPAGRSGCRIAAHFRGLAPEQRDYIDAYVAWHSEVYAASDDGGQADEEDLSAA
ncbi:MAG: hypothetical protein FJY75_00010 [Candidatus Eisenbacteria bacterium]|uniref:PilZ domain-containing protein n=1 Tax=Eiseniibacteriota bacterium TaxID=2212470 RepID=A0A938BPH9_UNCEI|nr:hypothetical protein [Candidatus Eisenbacteria bacterium]